MNAIAPILGAGTISARFAAAETIRELEDRRARHFLLASQSVGERIFYRALARLLNTCPQH